MNFRRADRGEVAINLTPLIDVVFLLLIFFMVSSRFSELSRLNVTLPEAEIGSALTEVSLLLTVDANGQMRLNGEQVPSDPPGLKQAIMRQINGNSDVPLTLSADAMTPHQYVVTALDVAAQLNLQQLTIATQPVSERGPR
ncbi:MAG: biopolymer transporter ExbD [Halieaceae bacterium]